jgi:hypothetical protein
MDTIEVLTLIGVLIPILGLIVEHFHYQADLQERITKIETRQEIIPTNTAEIRQMVEDIAEMKTKISLFWGALEDQLPALLLKGNPIDPDSEIFKLLQRYQKKQIFPYECPVLVDLLIEEAQKEDHDPGEKLAMVLTVAVVKANMKECSMHHEVVNRV